MLIGFCASEFININIIYLFMVKICFATGNLWRLMTKFDVIDIISKLDIAGVEYTYGKNLNERPIKEKEFDLLKDYSYISFHSPFLFSLYYLKENEFYDQLSLMEYNYSKLNAKAIVTHPEQTNYFPDKINSKMNFLTENMNLSKRKKRLKNGFENTIKKRPDFDLCIDINHCYSWGIDETERIVKKWKNKIKQVHFSNNRYGKGHLPFEKVSKDFLKSIEPLKDLNVPIIIEEDMPYTKIKDIKEEIKRVKKIIL